MDPEKIQSDIDTVLSFMNDDMEGMGGTIQSVHFSFVAGKSDRTAFDEKYSWSEDYLFKIINICNSRSLLKKPMGIFHTSR